MVSPGLTGFDWGLVGVACTEVQGLWLVVQPGDYKVAVAVVRLLQCMLV